MSMYDQLAIWALRRSATFALLYCTVICQRKLMYVIGWTCLSALWMDCCVANMKADPAITSVFGNQLSISYHTWSTGRLETGTHVVLHVLNNRLQDRPALAVRWRRDN